jgi:hypothetical protein
MTSENDTRTAREPMVRRRVDTHVTRNAEQERGE